MAQAIGKSNASGIVDDLKRESECVSRDRSYPHSPGTTSELFQYEVELENGQNRRSLGF